MKKKLGIIILLVVVAVGCFLIGQYQVKKSLFSASEDFNVVKKEYNGEDVLLLTPDSFAQGSLRLGSSYVSLTFDYEVYLPDEQPMPSDANLQIDITSPDAPDNHLQWAFEPGKMEHTGSMSVDIKAFQGKNIDMTFTCKGSFSEESGIVVRNVYISKMYAGG